MRAALARFWRAVADRLFWFLHKRELASPLTDEQLARLNYMSRLRRYVDAQLARRGEGAYKVIAMRDLLAGVMVALRTGIIRKRLTPRPGPHLRNASQFRKGTPKIGYARVLQITSEGVDGKPWTRNGDPALGYVEVRRDATPKVRHGRGRLRRLARSAERMRLSMSAVGLVT